MCDPVLDDEEALEAWAEHMQLEAWEDWNTWLQYPPKKPLVVKLPRRLWPKG